MIKVMHIITTLGPAGAETMLCRIASRMDGTRFQNEVVSLTGVMHLAKRMEAIGIGVRTLDMNAKVPNPLLITRLARWIRRSKPDVLHTWMYHANLIGSIAARVAGKVPVVWGIHHSALDPRVDKRRTIWVNRACAVLSKNIPSRIVCCSEASLHIHRQLSYAAEKLVVVPNGFDLEQIKRDPAAHASVREELGIPQDSLVIGLAARFHPLKDHLNFIQAAGHLHEQMPEVHFLLCGIDVTWQNSHLERWIAAAGIRDRCHLLGLRQDMPRMFAAMDIATTSSISEAFPVAIGEAMACETPCVVTNVGDSALLVGETGLAVAPRDAQALAAAWRTLIDAGDAARRSLGMAARNRVQRLFVLPTIVERYQEIYTEVAGGAVQGAPLSMFSQCS
jgi:glycosyltransferase involved in cell wall biosynthesis